VLKSGKRTKKVIVDEQGNYIGTQTVEDVIEGEVIE
jgi:Mg2+/Co2+ transporter CorB